MAEKIDQLAAPRTRQRNFEETHEILAEAYVAYLTNKSGNPKMRQPTIKQLVELTGIPKRTVERHLADLDRDVNFNRRSMKYKLGSDIIMKSWLKAAVNGNHAAGEKYMQVAEQMNFGAIVKVEMADLNPGPNLKALDKKQLAEYKALVKLMAGKADGGSPKSTP